MISYQTDGIEMPAIKKRETTEWIKAVAATYNKRIGEIAYIFCSDEKILEVNRQYLQHDYYTDIITFDYCEGNRLSGDLFISLDTVRTNAEQFAGNDYDFRYYYSNWDVSYAEDMFYRGHGDCFAFASAFAYLANAIGFEAKVISSGGHGWAEIKGEVCDPNWAKGTGHIERYYRMSYDLSGVDGRPYYRGNRAYVITI